jgi:outer membrane lipoprotein SlyB
MAFTVFTPKALYRLVLFAASVTAFRFAGCPQNANSKNRYKAENGKNCQSITPE